MGDGTGHGRGARRLGDLADDPLAALAGSGDLRAFETLCRRHQAPLLAFCRHRLGSREDGEDALQQTFLRAWLALRRGRLPEHARPWLYAIASNRCRTILAARGPAGASFAAPEVADAGGDALADEVRRRAALHELVTDLRDLPADQRRALVLAELGGHPHAEIAVALGCRPEKVRALVFQARAALLAQREARETPCAEIRGAIETAPGGARRRGPVRRHLRGCESCRAFRPGAPGLRVA